MALWTPLNLAVAPRLFVNAANATWSGSTLTALPNSGSDGGTGTVQGAPSKGATYNGISAIAFDADNKYVEYALSSISTGVLFNASAFALTGSSGAQGLLNGRWYSPSSAVFYARNDPTGTYAFYLNGSSTITPAAGTSGMVSSGAHLLSSLLGTTRAMHIDGVAQTLDLYDVNAAVGTITARTWEVGRGQYSGAAADESLLGDFLYTLLLSYAPTTSERQQIEGWSSWTFTGSGSLLPVGHPYKTAAPMTAFTGYGSGTYGTGNYSLIGAPVIASAAIDESQDTSSATGAIKIQAALAKTEAGDALSAASSLLIKAASSITEAGDTVSASAGAVVVINASAAITEAADSVSSSTSLRLRAVLAQTEAGDTILATGAHVGGPKVASAVIIEADDILAATAFAWRGQNPTPETWTPTAANDATWTPIAASATIWS